MEKHSVDFSAQARTNPVFMTAGLRVLLILQKGGAQVRLTGVNDAVWEILETTGFVDVLAVEREGR